MKRQFNQYNLIFQKVSIISFCISFFLFNGGAVSGITSSTQKFKEGNYDHLGKKILTAAGVYLRKAPSLDAKRIVMTHFGDIVFLIGISPENEKWFHVETQGHISGWIKAEFLTDFNEKDELDLYYRISKHKIDTSQSFGDIVDVSNFLEMNIDKSIGTSYQNTLKSIYLISLRKSLSLIPKDKHSEPPYKEWIYKHQHDPHWNTVYQSQSESESVHKETNETLISAAFKGDLNVVRSLLNKGEDVNRKNVYGTTALQQAVVMNHKQIVSLLIEKGADVNAKDNEGNTILIHAAWSSSKDIIRLLLEKGADVYAKNNKGNTALVHAVSGGNIDAINIISQAQQDKTITNHSSVGYSQETKYNKGLKSFAFVNDGYIYVVENEGDNPRRAAKGEAPDWSPVEPLLAFHGHEGGIFTVNLRTGKQKKIHKTGIEPRWSPDGALITFRNGEKHNQLLIANKTAVLRKPLDEISPSSSGPFWMPDSKAVLYVNDERGIPEIRKIPIDGGESVVLGNGYRVGFSPDRNLALIAVRPSRNEFALLLLDTRTKGTRIVFRDIMESNDDIIGCPLWSPTGKRVAVEIKKYGSQVSDDIIILETDSFELESTFRSLTLARLSETETHTTNVIWEIGSMAWTPDENALLVSLVEPHMVTSGVQLNPGEVGLLYILERRIRPEEVSEKDLLDSDKLVYVGLSQGAKSGQILQSGHAPVFRGGTNLLWMP